MHCLSENIETISLERMAKTSSQTSNNVGQLVIQPKSVMRDEFMVFPCPMAIDLPQPYTLIRSTESAIQHKPKKSEHQNHHENHSMGGGAGETVILDGETLTTDMLVYIGYGNVCIGLSDEAWNRIRASRQVIDGALASGTVMYGINTGFGALANTRIENKDIEQLQLNLIRSHSCGVGSPMEKGRSRMLFALRVNVLARGCSGISAETLQGYIDIFNEGLVPRVPKKGTVGASGDLAPLAHLALACLGEGEFWDAKAHSWTRASIILEKHGLKPVKLKAKEGLALINGTQFIAALGAEAVERCRTIALQADVLAALTLEALKGSARAFDARVHRMRPHVGQGAVARHLRALLNSSFHPSQISESHRNCGKVQDAYTLRCVPQVHGVVWDTIEFVDHILNTELNSVTDNPIIFSAPAADIICAGNFHGEYPAKALDYLAIAVHELGSISERRLERLVNPAYSQLPAFLVEKNPGLNSCFMMAHVTVAALVSENKVLCHPASIDTISTSAGTEDHVSMGGWAARKCLQVIENVQRVLAVELLAACQALEFHRPLTSTAPLEAVLTTVRSHFPIVDPDRYLGPEIEAAAALLGRGDVWRSVQPFMHRYACEVEPDEQWEPFVLADTCDSINKHTNA